MKCQQLSQIETFCLKHEIHSDQNLFPILVVSARAVRTERVIASSTLCPILGPFPAKSNSSKGLVKLIREIVGTVILV